MIPVRVLIIEDDVRISKVHAKFLLEVENFELVGVANSIKDGKEMVEILSPDLILLIFFFQKGMEWTSFMNYVRSTRQLMSF